MNTQTKAAESTDLATLPSGLSSGNQSLAVQLAMAELNQDVITARAFPRSVSTVMRNITELVMLDEQTAKECVYAVPRDGKTIRGPSIRLAEIIASQWGNCHCASRVVHVDKIEKYVESEGIFHDLETGLKRTARTRKNISKRDGGLYSQDMIMTAGNAAASIGMREAILKGVPKAVWRQALEHAEKVIRGDVTTLVERRDDAMKSLAGIGVAPERIFAAVGVAGIEEIGLDELANLFAMYQGVKSGETNVDEVFPAAKPKGDQPTTLKGKLDKLAGEDEQKQQPADKPEGAEAKGSEAGSSPSGTSEPSSGRAPAEPDDGDQIAAARRDGAEARHKKMNRKALPAEYQKDDDLRNGWLLGFDTGEAERQPGEEG